MPPASFFANPEGDSSSRCSLPRCAHRREAGPDLHAFDSVDTHQSVREICLELVEDRLAESDGNSAGAYRYLRANRVAIGAQPVHELRQLIDALRLGAKKRVVVHGR